MKLWQIFGAEFVLRHMKIQDTPSGRTRRITHLKPVRVDVTPEKIMWLKIHGFSVRRGWFGGFTPYIHNQKIVNAKKTELEAWGDCIVRWQMAGSKVIR